MAQFHMACQARFTRVHTPENCVDDSGWVRLQGNCSEAPQLQLEGPPLLPLLPGQCVLLVDMDFAHVGYGRLWMHNLYLRHVASARADGVYLVATTQASGWLWLTLTTLQGAGQYAYGAGATGLGAGSPTYVAGAALPSLGKMYAVGAQASAPEASPGQVLRGFRTPVHILLTRCTWDPACVYMSGLRGPIYTG